MGSSSKKHTSNKVTKPGSSSKKSAKAWYYPEEVAYVKQYSASVNRLKSHYSTASTTIEPGDANEAACRLAQTFTRHSQWLIGIVRKFEAGEVDRSGACSFGIKHTEFLQNTQGSRQVISAAKPDSEAMCSSDWYTLDGLLPRMEELKSWRTRYR